MSNPFFLTRQTANLMEDFNRQLKAGAELFLLYGARGVGKTRLMRELTRSRLETNKVHWIEMAQKEDGTTTAVDTAAQIESAFSAAGPGDIVIADHFELGLKKARHQLFLSWSTDGVDKKVNLVVISDLDGFNELRQLSQQYQVRVQTLQQMPFSNDEVSAFLGFYLFPDHPIGKLTIPASLRRQLAATQGAVGKVIDIADRDGAQIESAPMADTESIREGSRIVVGLLILFALTVGLGWYYLGSTDGIRQQLEQQGLLESSASSTSATETETAAETAADPQVVTQQPAPALEDEARPESEVAQAGNLLTEQELQVEPGEVDGSLVVKAWPTEKLVEEEKDTAAETETEASQVVEAEVAEAVIDAHSNDISSDLGSDPGSDITNDNEDQSSSMQLAENNTVESTDTPVEPSIEAANTIITGNVSERFRNLLVNSAAWINSKDLKLGTMQILLLSYDNFDESVYFNFLEYLDGEGIDIDQVRIFKTFTNGREVYSVVYGEYESWRAAQVARQDLPEALAKTRPLARSIGGLLEEIQDLSSQN